jgi:hypothetical protein
LAAGYDPFELRNRLTGSTCRGPMDPAFAMAEINLFGEVGVLKTINQLAKSEAKSLGKQALACLLSEMRL